jgi:hypothetical protein
MNAFRWAAYVWLLGFQVLGAAGAAELVGQIKPLGAPTRAQTPTAPLGELGRGLVTYLSFDGHLVSFDPLGREVQAGFERDSIAFLPDLTKVQKHVPRYQPGKFGNGLLMEYGYSPAGRNQFPPDLADAIPQDSPQTFQPVGDTGFGQATGLNGRSALKVSARKAGSGFATRPVVTPTTNKAAFSFYVHGKPGTTLTLAARKQNADTPLATTPVTLADGW